MHELSLMQSLVATIEESVGASRVVAVRLEVGRLAGVLPDALRFCFDVCAKSTRVEGAALELFEVPGRGRCRRCCNEFGIASLVPVCACGATDVEVVAGQELKLRNVEVV